MLKRERLYLGLFALLVILSVTGFVYSQAFLPSTGTVPNPGHSSEQILCVGCVDTANLKDNSVNGLKIANAAVGDSEVAQSSVTIRKLQGGNGWYFTTGTTALSTNVWTLSASTLVNFMSISSWDNAYAEIICDPIVDNAVRVYGGQQRDGVSRLNQQIVKLTSTPTTVYKAESSSVLQMLEVRSDGPSLSFRRTGAGSSSPPEPLSGQFECHLKILSFCGPPGFTTPGCP